MFKPIIHNLKKGDCGYKDAQFYNKLINNKPTGDMLLAKKIHLQGAWKRLCTQSLEAFKQKIKEL